MGKGLTGFPPSTSPICRRLADIRRRARQDSIPRIVFRDVGVRDPAHRYYALTAVVAVGVIGGITLTVLRARRSE